MAEMQTLLTDMLKQAIRELVIVAMSFIIAFSADHQPCSISSSPHAAQPVA